MKQQIIFAMLMLLTGAAQADLYKCFPPDGKTLYAREPCSIAIPVYMADQAYNKACNEEFSVINELRDALGNSASQDQRDRFKARANKYNDNCGSGSQFKRDEVSRKAREEAKLNQLHDDSEDNVVRVRVGPENKTESPSIVRSRQQLLARQKILKDELAIEQQSLKEAKQNMNKEDIDEHQKNITALEAALLKLQQ